MFACYFEDFELKQRLHLPAGVGVMLVVHDGVFTFYFGAIDESRSAQLNLTKESKKHLIRSETALET